MAYDPTKTSGRFRTAAQAIALAGDAPEMRVAHVQHLPADYSTWMPTPGCIYCELLALGRKIGLPAGVPASLDDLLQERFADSFARVTTAGQPLPLHARVRVTIHGRVSEHNGKPVIETADGALYSLPASATVAVLSD